MRRGTFLVLVKAAPGQATPINCKNLVGVIHFRNSSTYRKNQFKIFILFLVEKYRAAPPKIQQPAKLTVR